MAAVIWEEQPEREPSHYSVRDLEKSYESQINPVPSIYDPNIPQDSVTSIALEDDSPYPEVRAAVANFDDPSMPASTLRAWVLGLFWAIVLPGVNQFYYFRYPSIVVGGLVAQLLTFPMGRIWERIMPRISIFGVSVNPGPFTMKEHVLVTIMASVGAPSAYATDIIVVQRVMYHQRFGFMYQWMLVMSTQLIGFSIGGIARRFLVTPASMIWPNTLVLCALFNTLHSQRYAGYGTRDGISRERFFCYAFVGAAAWYWFPGYIFQALSVFDWVCWIVPRNVKVNQLFGYYSGLGFSLISFDWSQIAYIGSPLATPWWAEANVAVGFVVFYWIITPILYYVNAWDSQYLPMSSRSAFDNTGALYNATRIMKDDGTFDRQAYNAYSPLYLSATFAVSYGLSFASITATITHAVIYFWKPIKVQLKRSLREQPDIHARLMAWYAPVPEWWYATIFVVTFAFACLCIELWPTGMTIWALCLSLLLAVAYVVPVGMIQAITNRQVGLNVISELLAGFMLPGHPLAMMMFKTWGYITMSQAMTFTADFKLGHYMKVPPRPMFWGQVVSTIIAGTVQLGVQTWMFSHIPDMCSQHNQDKFICPGTEVFATASVVVSDLQELRGVGWSIILTNIQWGVVGPALMFAKGQVYYFFFLIGACCPVVQWLIIKRYPVTILNYVNFPLIFAGVGLMPPATAANYVPWAVVGFIFQYLVRRRYFAFWAKYNYVLSAALDAGTAVSTILIFFTLQYPRNGTIGKDTIQAWWGNTVFLRTADYNGTALRAVPDGLTFGPEVW
ncbi:oligopeptide transporter [Heliocybe sulcata]|uniref:Oligopeptide transporter n=1 Tax=Heliocybe sulcata TaxID=5364 RepID=A0A5C3MPQ9_9AGAM|nr:oligopeptide transporter [Heliocybe sulcata]